MKFTTFISTLALGAAAGAAATVAATTLDKRNHIVDQIVSSVERAANIVQSTEISIANATGTVVTTTGSDVSLIEPIIAQALQAISGALAVGGQGLTQATKDVVGAANQTTSGLGLNSPELQQLRSSIDTMITIMDGIYANVVLAVSTLNPDTQSLLAPELAGVGSVVQPFIGPVVAYSKIVTPLADSSTAADADAVVDGIAALECTADAVAVSLGL